MRWMFPPNLHVQAWTEFRGVEERNVSTSSDALVDGPDCILCSHRDATAERELPIG